MSEDTSARVRFSADAAYADGVRHAMYDSNFTLSDDRLVVQSLHRAGKGRVVTVQLSEITSVMVAPWTRNKDIRIEIARRATVDAMFKNREQASWFQGLLYAAMNDGLPDPVPPMP